MDKRRRIIDYYLKGLSPDCYRHVVGEIKECKHHFHDNCILAKERIMKTLSLNEEQYNFFYEILVIKQILFFCHFSVLYLYLSY